jgi:hypothetical protein
MEQMTAIQQRIGEYVLKISTLLSKIIGSCLFGHCKKRL